MEKCKRNGAKKRKIPSFRAPLAVEPVENASWDRDRFLSYSSKSGLSLHCGRIELPFRSKIPSSLDLFLSLPARLIRGEIPPTARSRYFVNFFPDWKGNAIEGPRVMKRLTREPFFKSQSAKLRLSQTWKTLVKEHFHFNGQSCVPICTTLCPVSVWTCLLWGLAREKWQIRSGELFFSKPSEQSFCQLKVNFGPKWDREKRKGRRAEMVEQVYKVHIVPQTQDKIPLPQKI